MNINIAIKRLYILISMVVAIFIMSYSTIISPQPAPAAPTNDPKGSICQGVGLAGGNCDDPANSSNLTNLISDVIGVISVVVGIAAVIMIMVGGFKYITSQGDGNSISSAKNTILYAIVGLIVALFAQLIVRFVINRV